MSNFMPDIPALKDRKKPTLPERRLRTGAAIIDRAACATCFSLDRHGHFIKKTSKISTSGHYYGHRNGCPIDYVVYMHGSDALQLPRSLEECDWPSMPEPFSIPTYDFLEESISQACYRPYSYLATLVEEKLWPAPNNRRLTFFQRHRLRPSADGTVHTPDFTIFSAEDASVRYVSGLEHNLTQGLLDRSWQPFPFNHEKCPWRALSQLSPSCGNILEQCIFYAAQYRSPDTEGISPTGKVLMGLALPPLKLYYLVCDFDARRVTVFENAVRLPDQLPDAALTPAIIGKLMVDAEAWRAYWRCALWFCVIVVAFHFESDIDAVVEADSQRNAPDRTLPSDFDEMRRRAVKSLSEVPPQSLWVYLSLRRALLTPYLMTLFIYTPYMFWIAFIWGQLDSRKVLKTAQYMNIPHAGTLNLRKNWGWLLFWHPATLPNCVEMWGSGGGNKRFYVYPNLRLFVKIFSCTAQNPFENEVKMFHRLSDIQGKAIPVLYASGRVTQSDEFCLIMSYEGQPLKDWNVDDRHRVQNLVRLLHRYQIHHHDIAERNVVVDERGKFTLIDFEHSEEGCQCTEEVDLGLQEEGKLVDT